MNSILYIIFTRKLIIMTSNIGARDLQDFGAGIGFGTKARQENMDELTKGTITNALRKTFSLIGVREINSKSSLV